MPTATIPTKETCRTTLVRLLGSRNRGLATAKKTKMKDVTSRIAKSRLANNCCNETAKPARARPLNSRSRCRALASTSSAASKASPDGSADRSSALRSSCAVISAVSMPCQFVLGNLSSVKIRCQSELRCRRASDTALRVIAHGWDPWVPRTALQGQGGQESSVPRKGGRREKPQVKGQPCGLHLSAEDKMVLLGFLGRWDVAVRTPVWM